MLAPLHQIERNKRLVTELSEYLPDKRDQLNAGIIRVSLLAMRRTL